LYACHVVVWCWTTRSAVLASFRTTSGTYDAPPVDATSFSR
jgi:hypothetical protein